MFNNEQGIVKVDGKWWFCNLNKWRYKKLQQEEVEEKKINELGKFSNLEEFVIKYWKKQKPAEYILNKLCCEEIRILVSMPIEPTPDEWESYFFRDLNELCLGCEKTCKQSAHVKVVSCPQHKKIKK